MVLLERELNDRLFSIPNLLEEALEWRNRAGRRATDLFFLFQFLEHFLDLLTPIFLQGLIGLFVGSDRVDVVWDNAVDSLQKFIECRSILRETLPTICTTNGERRRTMSCRSLPFIS